MLTHPTLALWSVRIALLVCCFEIGGSLYEHLVVDRAWPAHPALIQPQSGGLDRKQFWMPLHVVLTLALPVALWACWRLPSARAWLLAAGGAYLVLRGVTFAYFIPRALHFEAGDGVTADAALTWVRLSLARAPLLLLATFALWRAALTLPR